MPEIEERQAKIEGILEQLIKRVDRLEMELNEIRKELNEFRNEIRKELHMNFRWLVGIIVVTWVTTVVTILLKV